MGLAAGRSDKGCKAGAGLLALGEGLREKAAQVEGYEMRFLAGLKSRPSDSCDSNCVLRGAQGPTHDERRSLEKGFKFLLFEPFHDF
jgi:hypothetical protein